MDNCSTTNQYSDVLNSDGTVNRDKCFKGSEIYSKMKNFNFNEYSNYKSKEYYNYINDHFIEYSFPVNYSELSFDQICKNTEYSLKEQQKFAGRIFNNSVDNKGLLIYHGLGSGKTQTSIIIGEAFKFRNTDGNQIPNRADSYVLIIVPASLTEQYYSEILGRLDSQTGKVKSASG
jgi:hypothetical protein